MLVTTCNKKTGIYCKMADQSDLSNSTVRQVTQRAYYSWDHQFIDAGQLPTYLTLKFLRIFPQQKRLWFLCGFESKQIYSS
jgi:hypothetical protein